MFEQGRHYLITGGAGFLGRAMIRRLLEHNCTHVRVVSRNTGELVKLTEDYPYVRVVTGDIADPYICRKALDGADTVFHFAAFKHISMAEDNVWECINSNVIGTMNMLKYTMGETVSEFVLTSTDKASCVRGVYGATKMLCERLVLEAEHFNKYAKFRIVRYGNVWNSTGSFITKWIPSIKAGKGVTLTDPNATRFFFTVNEAVNVIIESLIDGKSAEPMYPKLKSISMGEVVQALQQVFGAFPVKTIGLQKGENLHETMDGITYSNQVERYTKDEFIQKFICPTLL